MSSLPSPIRAALGVALTAVDTARETATHLPQLAAGLPVAVASQAVQLSLRAQQQYAAYVNKGDELIGAFRGAPEEPPAWATFDDEEPTGPTPARNTAFDRVPDAEEELAELEALDELTDLADVLADDDAPVASVTPIGTDLVGDEEPPVTEADLERPAEEELAHLGPAVTPGAPDIASSEPEVIARDAAGDEVFGADAPRSTTPREPGRKATRKVATKAVRKTAAKKAPPAKKAAPAAKKAAPAAKKAAKKAAPPTTGVGATAGLPAAPPAKKAAKAAKKAAGKAAAKKTLPPAEDQLRTPELPLPAGPDSQVSDTQPSADRPDEL